MLPLPALAPSDAAFPAKPRGKACGKAFSKKLYHARDRVFASARGASAAIGICKSGTAPATAPVRSGSGRVAPEELVLPRIVELDADQARMLTSALRLTRHGRWTCKIQATVILPSRKNHFKNKKGSLAAILPSASAGTAFRSCKRQRGSDQMVKFGGIEQQNR